MKLDFLDEVVSRHKWTSIEGERQGVIDRAKELEKKFLKMEITKDEYEHEKKKAEQLVILLDIEISFRDIVKQTQEMEEKHARTLHLDENRRYILERLMQKNTLAKEDIHEGKILFEKDKLGFKILKELLIAKKSEALEIEEDVDTLYRSQTLDMAKQMEILLRTQKELEEKKAEEIAEDLFIQIPKGENMEFPGLRKITKTSHKN